MVKEQDLFGRSIRCNTQKEYNELVDLLYNNGFRAYNNDTQEERKRRFKDSNWVVTDIKHNKIFSGSASGSGNTIDFSDFISSFNKSIIYELW